MSTRKRYASSPDRSVYNKRSKLDTAIEAGKQGGDSDIEEGEVRSMPNAHESDCSLGFTENSSKMIYPYTTRRNKTTTDRTLIQDFDSDDAASNIVKSYTDWASAAHNPSDSKAFWMKQLKNRLEGCIDSFSYFDTIDVHDRENRSLKSRSRLRMPEIRSFAALSLAARQLLNKTPDGGSIFAANKTMASDILNAKNGLRQRLYDAREGSEWESSIHETIHSPRRTILAALGSESMSGEADSRVETRGKAQTVGKHCKEYRFTDGTVLPEDEQTIYTPRQMYQPYKLTQLPSVDNHRRRRVWPIVLDRERALKDLARQRYQLDSALKDDDPFHRDKDLQSVYACIASAADTLATAGTLDVALKGQDIIERDAAILDWLHERFEKGDQGEVEHVQRILRDGDWFWQQNRDEEVDVKSRIITTNARSDASRSSVRVDNLAQVKKKRKNHLATYGSSGTRREEEGQ